ncbi:hypothetical protein FBU30_011176 [Linnemannia zychae]|nr:hypothetical protein FBU30_011176 [Linnemannia zychae]
MPLWPKSTISVEEAINLVTSNIALIRKANSVDEVLKCRPDKATEYKVDNTSNQSMIIQLAAVFREHAELLKNKGCTNSIVKAVGVLVARTPAARICLSSAHFDTPTTSLSTCTTLSPTQPSISLSFVNADTPTVLRSVEHFDRDVYSFAFDIWSFPSPNCQFQDTHQLAACLTYLCTTGLPEDDLLEEVRKWIVATRSKTVELERLKKIASDVTYAFIKTNPKDSEIIAEVALLAYNLDRDLHRHLLNSFVDTINHSTLLNIDILDGLAHVVQSADPGYINSDDLVNAMVAANVGDIDRINLYDSSACLLDTSKSGADLYLSFQVEYAAQALLNISNDETPWHAGFRRLWLALSFGASFTKVPDPTEIKSILEGLEKLYNVGKRDFIALKEAINSKGKVRFTFKDGFQFKSIWYRALRTAELYIQTGRLSYFEEFVTNAQCRDDRMFQLGVCQLLGQFVADTRWDLKARQSAIGFIRALYRNETNWILHDGAKQVIFDALICLESDHSIHFEGTLSLLSIYTTHKETTMYASVYCLSFVRYIYLIRCESPTGRDETTELYNETVSPTAFTPLDAIQRSD